MTKLSNKKPVHIFIKGESSSSFMKILGKIVVCCDGMGFIYHNVEPDFKCDVIINLTNFRSTPPQIHTYDIFNRRVFSVQDKKYNVIDVSMDINDVDHIKRLMHLIHKDLQKESKKESKKEEPKILKKFKLLVVGDGATGKTTFIKHHLTGEFDKRYNATMGVDVHSLELNTNKGKVIFDVWDSAGQEKFGGLRDGYYIGADAALVFYDVKSIQTRSNIPNWIADVKRVCKEIPIIKVGSKDDSALLTIDTHPTEDRCWISTKINSNMDLPFLKVLKKLMGNEIEIVKPQKREDNIVSEDSPWYSESMLTLCANQVSEITGKIVTRSDGKNLATFVKTISVKQFDSMLPFDICQKVAAMFIVDQKFKKITKYPENMKCPKVVQIAGYITECYGKKLNENEFTNLEEFIKTSSDKSTDDIAENFLDLFNENTLNNMKWCVKDAKKILALKENELKEAQKHLKETEQTLKEYETKKAKNEYSAKLRKIMERLDEQSKEVQKMVSDPEFQKNAKILGIDPDHAKTMVEKGFIDIENYLKINP
jgi:GTP-binding nuclear protein Ran